MSTTSSSFLCLFAFLTVVTARAVNISNIWYLPQEGFPVFYRYFRDRVTWFEADAVCQFHHANLVTVDTSRQYDATRAYLKELDVVNNVWIGLKKTAANTDFLWTDYKILDQNGGYWQEKIPQSESDLCAVIDPAADFRWHSLNCGGPESASFICELPVPPWAKKVDGCMLTALPSLTVTYLPEQAVVELTSDCGLDGTRRIACKGQADHSEMMHQLSCENSNGSSHEIDEEEKPVSASSTTLDTSSHSAGKTESHQLATRHRRDANSINHLLPDSTQTTHTIAEETTTRAYDITSTTLTSSSEPDTSSVSISELQTSAETTSTEYMMTTEVLQKLEDIKQEEETDMVDFLTTASSNMHEIVPDFTEKSSEKFVSTNTMPSEKFLSINTRHGNESSEKLHGNESSEKFLSTSAMNGNESSEKFLSTSTMHGNESSEKFLSTSTMHGNESSEKFLSTSTMHGNESSDNFLSTSIMHGNESSEKLLSTSTMHGNESSAKFLSTSTMPENESSEKFLSTSTMHGNESSEKFLSTSAVHGNESSEKFLSTSAMHGNESSEKFLSTSTMHGNESSEKFLSTSTIHGNESSEKFLLTNTMHNNENPENETAKYQEELAANKTEITQTGIPLYMSMTRSISDIIFNDINNIPSEYMSNLNQNYSKSETEGDKVHNKNSEEVNRRRQLLPTPLRDLPQNEDNGLHESETKPDNDWSLTNDSQLQPTDTEIPVKPNRGRRLTRPQAHSFYPYFLNRVLG